MTHYYESDDPDEEDTKAKKAQILKTTRGKFDSIED